MSDYGGDDGEDSSSEGVDSNKDAKIDFRDNVVLATLQDGTMGKWREAQVAYSYPLEHKVRSIYNLRAVHIKGLRVERLQCPIKTGEKIAKKGTRNCASRQDGGCCERVHELDSPRGLLRKLTSGVESAFRTFIQRVKNF